MAADKFPEHSDSEDTSLPVLMGQQIRRIREERGWSQRLLAARLGISADRLSRYEKGAYEAPLRTLIRLSQLFGVPVDFFLPAADPHESELRVRLRQVLSLRERATVVVILDALLGMWGFFQTRSGASQPWEG